MNIERALWILYDAMLALAIAAAVAAASILAADVVIGGECANCADSHIVGVGPVKFPCPLCLGGESTPEPLAAAEKPDPSKAVCRVVVTNGGRVARGSGVLVESGLVLTAAHVIEPGELVVHFQGGEKSPGKVRMLDRRWDVAAIEVEPRGIAPVPLAAQSPKGGDSLTLAGYGQYPSKYREQAGKIVDYRQPVGGGGGHWIVLDAEARQGDSGGPVFNARGEVAAIVWGVRSKQAYATEAGKVRELLSAPAASLACPDGRCQKR